MTNSLFLSLPPTILEKVNHFFVLSLISKMSLLKIFQNGHIIFSITFHSPNNLVVKKN